MKNILTIIVLFFVCAAHAQKTKTFTVCNDISNKLNVRGIIHYNEKNIATDTSYYLSVSDDQYTMLSQSIILINGTLQDIYTFIKEVQYAVNLEDVGVTLTIKGCPVHICKVLGLRSGIINDPSGGNGYCCYDYGQLYGALKKIEKYCTKHGVKLENLWNKDDLKKKG